VIATQNADGNAMIQCAQPCATQFASDQSAKSIAKRLNVLSARFTVTSLNATFVAPRIYARRRTALSVRLFAPQPTAALNVKLLTLSAPQCARPPSVTGSARSQSLALSQSASLCASAQLVTLVPVRLVPRPVAATAPIRLTWLPPSELPTPSWRSTLRLQR